jgi:hypothetical protein
MGFFRFRKTIKLLPGMKINLSKTGISTSLGGPGASVNLGHGQVKGTVGIPGTGLSYQEQTRKRRRRSSPQGQYEIEAISQQVTASTGADEAPTVVDFVSLKGFAVSVIQQGTFVRVKVDTLEITPLPRLLHVAKNEEGHSYLALSTGHLVTCDDATAGQVTELLERALARRADALSQYWESFALASFGAKIVMLIVFPIIGLALLAQKAFFRPHQ